MAETTYLVFKKNGTGAYGEVGRVDAPTPKIAIERIVDKIMSEADAQPLTQGSVFAATPFRNWTQLPVSVELETRIKVG